MPILPGAEQSKVSASCSSTHQSQQCTPWILRVHRSSANCSRQPSLQSAADTPPKLVMHLQDPLGAQVSCHLQNVAAACEQQQACAKACNASRPTHLADPSTAFSSKAALLDLGQDCVSDIIPGY